MSFSYIAADIFLNVFSEIFAQLKYNFVAQMKYCIFQKLAQMQYARIFSLFSW